MRLPNESKNSRSTEFYCVSPLGDLCHLGLDESVLRELSRIVRNLGVGVDVMFYHSRQVRVENAGSRLWGKGL